MNAQSVRDRLLVLSRETREDYQRLLTRYAIERVLYRLSQSPHAEALVLKGATLFAVWTGKPHRATKDLDLLGRGDARQERWVRVFADVLTDPSVEDGVVFAVDQLQVAPIRAETAYAGTRLTVPAFIAKARIKVQIDIGQGDATVPPPTIVEIPSLLDLPATTLRAYRPETVVAEKLEALVVLGLLTSRMKDLYDLHTIRNELEVDDHLVDAVRATFQRRQTPLPEDLPVGLSDAFANDEGKQKQWMAFLRKATDGESLALAEVVTELREWLWPVLRQARLSS